MNHSNICNIFLLVLLLSNFFLSDVFGQNNQVIKQANEAGIKTCLPAVTAISQFLIGSAPHGADDAWAPKDTDNQIYSTTIECVKPTGTSFTSLTAAPVSAGDCSIVYEQIEWFPTSCIVVSQERFPKLEYKGTLAGKVAVLEGGASVYLLPAGNGCLMLKKEVITNANLLGKKKKQ